MSYEELNRIFGESTSLPNFAKNAMLHLFTKAELTECHNVSGRSLGSKNNSNKRGLDWERVDNIRLMVDQNSVPSAELWAQCVRVMNKKISQMN